jgi:hypothetical protein
MDFNTTIITVELEEVEDGEFYRKGFSFNV